MITTINLIYFKLRPRTKVVRNGSLVKLSCALNPENSAASSSKYGKFDLLLNPCHFKVGDLSKVKTSKTIEIARPWNEYRTKNGTRLLFNPSKVKYLQDDD